MQIGGDLLKARNISIILRTEIAGKILREALQLGDDLGNSRAVMLQEFKAVLSKRQDKIISMFLTKSPS